MRLETSEETMPQPQTPANSEAAILSRVIQAKKPTLSRQAAKDLLDMGFTKEDRERMHQLAVKNQRGALSSKEEHELDNYVRVGRLLDLLSAKARKSLQTVSKH
jgi:hypothetical protein